MIYEVEFSKRGKKSKPKLKWNVILRVHTIIIEWREKFIAVRAMPTDLSCAYKYIHTYIQVHKCLCVGRMVWIFAENKSESSKRKY